MCVCVCMGGACVCIYMCVHVCVRVCIGIYEFGSV